jgi:hypothetical protein
MNGLPGVSRDQALQDVDRCPSLRKDRRTMVARSGLSIIGKAGPPLHRVVRPLA